MRVVIIENWTQKKGAFHWKAPFIKINYRLI